MKKYWCWTKTLNTITNKYNDRGRGPKETKLGRKI